MPRKISERNEFPEFDLFQEYQKIETLLSDRKIIGLINRHRAKQEPSLTIEEYIGQFNFNDWNLRGTFLSISEMRKGLKITKEQINVKPLDEEKILDFLQFALNCVFLVVTTIEECRFAYIVDKSLLTVIYDNIIKLLERLDCEIELNKETEEIYIKYKDDIANVVAADFSDIAVSISEYKRLDSRGDLQRKGEILCTLFKKLESIEDI